MSKKKKKVKLPKCQSCDREMTKVGGYEGTGLCGVCATGESAMLDEFANTW